MVAMSLGESFSRLLLKRLVDDVFRVGGVEALETVVDFLTRCGERDDPRLTAALRQAMQRAWHALETALGDKRANDFCQAALSPREAQALRQCLHRVLTELAHGGDLSEGPTVPVVANALRRLCERDLHCARVQGALAGCLDSDEWARSNELFVRFAVEQGRGETRRRTEAQFLRDLEEGGYVGLMRLLTGASGLPLLLMAGRAFVCQELAHLLHRCLQECPEQTPNNCALVLEILHELSCPHFTVWRAPAAVAAAKPVHWSRLESPRGPRRVGRRAARPPRVAVLTIIAALLIVLPIGMLLDNARHHHGEQRRLAEQQQRLRDERRRIDEERQRQIDEQRRIARQEEAERQARQRQDAAAERRQRLEAEEERQRLVELAVQRRQEERRLREVERQARLREEERRLERAKVALEDGLMQSALRRDREALTSLSEAIRLDPKLDRAYAARAEVRRRLKDVAGALEDYHEVVRRAPADVASWLACGELHAERRQHRQAIDAFTVVLRRQPRNADLYRRRGLSYAALDERDKALADQTRAIDLTPQDPWAYLYRGNLYRRRNEFARAFADFTSAIDRNRDDRREMAEAYRERGMLQSRWGLYEHAIKDLARALELDAADTAALRARGMAHLRNSDWTNALLDAESLLRHNAEDTAAYKLRGQAYMGSKEYQRAHEDFSRVLRRGRDAETFYLRARVKVHLGDVLEAIYDCNDATAINPRLAGAFYLRGKLNLRTGYRVSGLDDCRTAHELDSHFPLP
jgi:tetratricopeptide (TPR) repeat protein